MSLLNTIRRLLGKKKNSISRSVMKQMVLSGETLTIHTSKLGGSRIRRDVFAVVGPTGNMDYDYSAKGYIVLYDETAGGYRTFVWNNITKITDSKGVEYIVQ